MSLSYQRVIRVVGVLSVVALSLAIAACAGVRGRRGTPTESGFLRDYSQLKQMEGYEAQLIYINPGAAWSSYSAIYIDSVTLWGGTETQNLSAEDQQMLTDYLYAALHEEIGKRFTVAKGAGAGVLRLRAALTQAKGAKVAMKTITTVVPQLRLLTTVAGVGADVAATVGGATVEVEITDAITGERLAAAVDERVGKKAFTQLGKWSDVKAACDFWAERVTQFLVRQGVRTAA